jgi:hypothetical protein
MKQFCFLISASTESTLSSVAMELKLVLVSFNPDFFNTIAQAADTEGQLARTALPTLFLGIIFVF